MRPSLLLGISGLWGCQNYWWCCNYVSIFIVFPIQYTCTCVSICIVVPTSIHCTVTNIETGPIANYEWWRNIFQMLRNTYWWWVKKISVAKKYLLVIDMRGWRYFWLSPPQRLSPGWRFVYPIPPQMSPPIGLFVSKSEFWALSPFIHLIRVMSTQKDEKKKT